MKTLKEELQEIVDEHKLNTKTSESMFICSTLSKQNRIELLNHKEMARNYAKKYYYGGLSWWAMFASTRKDNFVIREKYRFIKDLIVIL